jgi:hypothetical protein
MEVVLGDTPPLPRMSSLEPRTHHCNLNPLGGVVLPTKTADAHPGLIVAVDTPQSAPAPVELGGGALDACQACSRL